MFRKNTPPWKGESLGPMIVACKDATGRVWGRAGSAGSLGVSRKGEPSLRGCGRSGAACRTCQWNKSSPTGPALHEEGGSLPMSCNSF